MAGSELVRPRIKRPAAREFPTQTAPGAAPQTSLPNIRDLILRVRRLEAAHQSITPNEWNDATVETGWSNAGAPYFNAGYRLGIGDDTLELRGNVTPDSPSSSGTVAFTLPIGFRPSADVSFVTDIEYGAGFTAARVLIESATGDVTIEFPCECGMIIGT